MQEDEDKTELEDLTHKLAEICIDLERGKITFDEAKEANEEVSVRIKEFRSELKRLKQKNK